MSTALKDRRAGRTARGELRRYDLMSDEHLSRVADRVLAESNDRQAASAVAAELNLRDLDGHVAFRLERLALAV